MSFLSKQLKMVNATLLSGSSDRLRTAFGAGWLQQSSSDNGATLEPYTDTGFLVGGSPYISSLSEYTSDVVGAVDYAAHTVQPIIKYPIRLYGDMELIKSDKHWKAYLYGGTFKEQEYEGIFTAQEFENHWFYYSLPYTVLEAAESTQPIKKINKIDVSYEYNHHMAVYENYVNNLQTELLIPNMYMLQAASEIDDTTRTLEEAYVYYNKDILNFISREEAVPQDVWTKLFVTTEDKERRELALEHDLPVPANMLPKVRGHRVRKYLNQRYTRHAISSSTALAVAEKLQNILFDDIAMQTSFFDTLENKRAMPYYIKIAFDASPGGNFVEEIKQNDFSSKFLVSLKDTFGANPTLVLPAPASFTVQETGHLNKNRETNEVSTVNFRAIDYGDLINHARLNYLTTMKDYCFVGRQDLNARKSAMDLKGHYRYINTISSTKTLANYLDFVDNDTYLEKIKSPYKKENAPTFLTPETMAYRVEKIGGPATGDSLTQNVIQNFWFINTTNLYDKTTEEVDWRTGKLSQEKDFQFLDSQVKYGEDYTYNIYAYVLVAGSRYQASNLVVTRTIGEIEGPLMAFPGHIAPPTYCLEFYNPETGETKPRLFIDESTSLEGRNEFATDAQINSENKYVADYIMSVQPSLRLLEIPITTKTLKVLDHPANTVTALPFFPEDNSHSIGFDVEYRAFEEMPFPKIVDEYDGTYKADYLNANNLLESSPLKRESTSRPRYMEMYRIQEKPKTYRDFANQLVTTVDLRRSEMNDDSESKQTIKEYLFYDTIKTNQKYYYMFRFLNEHRTTSQPSLIYQAKLIDDGGYLYTEFDTLFIQDLEEDLHAKTDISFKKLINITPNFQHLLFDDSDVDYLDHASNQIPNLKVGSADVPIWNKRFKIRLTSKKTGKKIDLNITYELGSE